MTAEFIFVGTELLLGNIVNTNGAYLARECAALGLCCYYQTVVGDNEDRLEAALVQAMGRADVVLLCGGLGPTQDDLTKETAAKVCGRRLYLHEPSRRALERFFALRGQDPTENNWKQAMMPEGGIVLENKNGTAPGVIIETDKVRVILLPGPPNELCPLFREKVAPYLAGLTEQVICSRTVKLCGVGESKAETLIKDLIDAQTNPTLATYAKTGEVHIRVTAAAADQKSAEALIVPVIEELERRFAEAVYATQEETTLEQAAAELLKRRGWTLACAESCTGGLLSGRLVNVPGVSNVYREGFVTYSDEAKRKRLGVRKRTLKQYGAVSPQTAWEMAAGAARAAGTDAAIAVTGVAGPGGGAPKKPVGLVYIGCFADGEITVKKYRFSGDRSKIRESAVAAALTLLRSCVLRRETGKNDTDRGQGSRKAREGD